MDTIIVAMNPRHLNNMIIIHRRIIIQMPLDIRKVLIAINRQNMNPLLSKICP